MRCGSTCYGLADAATGSVVFRQVGVADPEQITTLPGGFFPAAISQDGGVVVGGLANGRPAFWRSDTGLQDLVGVLDAGGMNTSLWSPWRPLTAVSADGRVMSGSAVRPQTGLSDCFVAVPYGPLCYANCDGSSVAPVLNVNDFVCFLAKFAEGGPDANCDGSTTPPILNVNDLLCFQARFAAGCS